jgi:hypothetical protein
LSNNLLKLTVYVPDSHVEAVKQALFAAGAGVLGDYQHCAWQTLGTGQYQPTGDAQPFLGQVGQLHQLAEWKVEVVLPQVLKDSVRSALVSAHPYETPAYDFISIMQ